MPGWLSKSISLSVEAGGRMKLQVIVAKESGAVREWFLLELAEVKAPRRFGSV